MYVLGRRRFESDYHSFKYNFHHNVMKIPFFLNDAPLQASGKVLFVFVERNGKMVLAIFTPLMVVSSIGGVCFTL